MPKRCEVLTTGSVAEKPMPASGRNMRWWTESPPYVLLEYGVVGEAYIRFPGLIERLAVVRVVSIRSDQQPFGPHGPLQKHFVINEIPA